MRSAGQDGELRARQAGFDHHLVKPIDYTVFSQLLEQVAPGTRGPALGESAGTGAWLRAAS